MGTAQDIAALAAIVRRDAADPHSDGKHVGTCPECGWVGRWDPCDWRCGGCGRTQYGSKVFGFTNDALLDPASWCGSDRCRATSTAGDGGPVRCSRDDTPPHTDHVCDYGGPGHKRGDLVHRWTT